MKILRITTEINRGSIGRSTEQIGLQVINEGWDSYIAFGRCDGFSESKKIRIGNKLSVYSHVLLTRLLDLHGYGSYFATKQFINKIKQVQPDLIHLHDIHGYYINYNILFEYLKESNIPVVWTHHDCWAFTGHCGFYSEYNCQKWKTGCNDCPAYKNYPSSIFDGSARNYVHKKKVFTSLPVIYNVGVSQWICDELKLSFLSKYPSRCIYNGIDTEVFKPVDECGIEVRKKYKLGNNKLLIAVATAWSERKGLFDYYQLRDKLGPEYTMVFVGVPDSLKKHLPDGIIGISRTDSMQELAKLYSTSFIVMNLASAESFGKTTPEGLACGIPSIVYNCTASPELVDEKTGIIVEKGDIDSVVDAISKISEWDRNMTRLECRKRACDKFSIYKNWPKYIALYKEILGNK